MPIRHVRKISFVVFFYNGEVTIRKRQSVCEHFAETDIVSLYPILLQLCDVSIFIFGRLDGCVIQSTTDEDCFRFTDVSCFIYECVLKKVMLE